MPQKITKNRIETLVNGDIVRNYIFKKYNKDGIVKEIKYLNGKKELHNNNGPALVMYYENGNIKSKYWYQNGKLHRECEGADLPVSVGYYENGNISCEEWYQNDEVHRDGNLPAIIKYNIDGKVINNLYR